VISQSKSVAIWDQPMKFQFIPIKGLGWDKLLYCNKKFIPKSGQIPEKLASLGSTLLLFKS
jgi:hypothetical protein